MKQQFTTRISLAGTPYPRCQHGDDAEQCDRSVYADDCCWNHYIKTSKSLPTPIPASQL